MNCTEFLSRDSHELRADALEHIRECEACLNASVSDDPVNLFRGLGPLELEPEGGIDAFVAGVMEQVDASERQKRLTAPRSASSGWMRYAVAAGVAGVLVAAGLYFPAHVPQDPATFTQIPVTAQADTFVSRPVVEQYQSLNATIVEMPGQSDFQLVMVFDESLPADL